MDNYEEELKNFSTFLLSLSPLEFSTLGAVLGTLFSIPLTIAEINTIGNFFELVGQIMLTYGSQKNLVSKNKDQIIH